MESKEMDVTPPGTRGLIRKYIEAVEKKDPGRFHFEEELAKRIGPGNAVMIDGKIIAAHKGEILTGKISFWVTLFNRIKPDKQDDKTPIMLSPTEEAELEAQKEENML